MVLTNKEREELKTEVKHEYFDKKKRPERGVTIGDISRDMGHSNRQEIIDIANEITRER